MGRRAQANARTLSWAVRKLFQPLLTEVPPVLESRSEDGSPVNASSSGDLISTQLDETQPPVQKKAGKREYVDKDDDRKEEANEQIRTGERAGETQYRKSNLPPALNKCERIQPHLDMLIKTAHPSLCPSSDWYAP